MHRLLKHPQHALTPSSIHPRPPPPPIHPPAASARIQHAQLWRVLGEAGDVRPPLPHPLFRLHPTGGELEGEAGEVHGEQRLGKRCSCALARSHPPLESPLASLVPVPLAQDTFSRTVLLFFVVAFLVRT